MSSPPLNILIAEDEQSHVTAIRRSLEKMYPDACISVVTSIQEYQDLVAAAIPSLAILDLNLRDGRTIELLSSPAGESAFPKIMMTSCGSEQVAADAIKRGAMDYIVKSSDSFAAIGTTVAGALREWQLLQDKKRMELQLKQSQALIIQQEKMASIGQLAAGVAHEINNPVGFVNSNLGTLANYIASLFRVIAAYETVETVAGTEAFLQVAELKKSVDFSYLLEDIPSLLKESQEGLSRVKRIVQDLKDFSHVDESNWQFASIEQGLESTLNVVANEIKYKAVVQREYAGLPEVECLPSQLNQVFMNMLINAAQAIENKGVITVRTGVLGDEVWVEVEDTGKGISPEHLNRIFDPFFTTKPVGRGTGLGLSLSYGIVQKHHGRIEVKSELGRGSVFRVYLPQRQLCD